MNCEAVFERFKFNCAQYPEKPAIFICRLTAACFELTEQEVINAVGLVHAMNAARGQWEKNDPPKVEGT